jgi:hypothetical protein
LAPPGGGDTNHRGLGDPATTVSTLSSCRLTSRASPSKGVARDLPAGYLAHPTKSMSMWSRVTVGWASWIVGMIALVGGFAQVTLCWRVWQLNFWLLAFVFQKGCFSSETVEQASSRPCFEFADAASRPFDLRRMLLFNFR